MARIGVEIEKLVQRILVLLFISFVLAANISAASSSQSVGDIFPGILLLIIVAYGLYLLFRRRPESKPTTKSTSATSITWKTSARWIIPGDTVTIAGRNIGGMIYLGPEPRKETWRQEGSTFINQRLPVSKTGSDISGQSMPYWPHYGDINPKARAAYLDWLASGRSDKRYGLGYVFLYFYGLERRFFLDKPDEQEKHVLIAEVERLLGIYGESHSVQRYLGIFLDVGKLVMTPTGQAEPRFESSGYELPLSLRVTIGRMAEKKQALSADWALGWYIAHPEYSLRTPATRAFLEFHALFSQLFEERFPNGVEMRTPKRLLCAHYTAASRAFEVDLNDVIGNVPDISGISQPLNVVNNLVEEATTALDKYSRFLGRNPEGRNSIEAHALLPQRLWSLFPNTEMKKLLQWAEAIIRNGGLSLVERVIERLEGTPPEKIGKRQLIAAADALARLSIGIAPDPRFALRPPKFGEPVILFRLPEGITALEEVSDNYKSLLVAIAMGSFVGHADGTLVPKERSALNGMIDVAEVSETESARLRANLQWFHAVPPDFALFRQRLRNISENDRLELSQVALIIAAADGVIHPREIKAIEKLYNAIGLKVDSVYSDLHALTSRSEPVTVRRAKEPERAFTVPPPARENQVILDSERIASIMANTARVSSILGDIFRDDETEEELDEILENSENGFSGLDAKHATFLGELLTRPHWKEAEFVTLANQFRLMHAGALETVNEWSFQRFDEVLIEEYEGYNINPEIAAELKN